MMPALAKALSEGADGDPDGGPGPFRRPPGRLGIEPRHGPDTAVTNPRGSRSRISCRPVSVSTRATREPAQPAAVRSE